MIHPSTAADVDRLIAELRSAEPIRRETASARLAVIGVRAVDKLHQTALDAAAPIDARSAALDALAAIGDPRSFETAARLAEGDIPRIAAAATDVLGSIARVKDRRSLKAFEWLTATALRTDASDERRLEALNALAGLSERQVAPIYAALRRDVKAEIAAGVLRQTDGRELTLDRVADEGLPDDPALVSAIAREEGRGVRVTTLRRVIERVRAHERETQEKRAEWRSVRGKLHQLLAERASRLALYDLRETLEAAAAPMPVGFLAAAAMIGDAACLAPLAAAWVSAAGRDRWWSEHLADAFRSIVRRERLTRRDPRLVKILEKWPAAGPLVAEAKRG